MHNSDVQDHLSYQESILQSTRSLHYVFQAIFLGIAVALISLGFSLLENLRENLRVILPVSVISVTIIILIIYGLKFLNDYSDRIYKRGLIIDFIQYMRLHSNLEENLIEEIFENPKKDYLFTTIKIIERVVSDFDEKYKNPSKLNLDRASFPYSKALRIKKLDLFIYILFYCDTRITPIPSKYVLGEFSWDDEEVRPRGISEARKGHKGIIAKLWMFLAILTFTLGFEVFFLISTG